MIATKPPVRERPPPGLLMAGIIGQLTANARKIRNTKKIRSDKCMYQIPEFSRTGFVPLDHNRYLRNRTRVLAMRETEQEEEDIKILEIEKVKIFVTGLT